jgi:N-glycosidase YbiA
VDCHGRSPVLVLGSGGYEYRSMAKTDEYQQIIQDIFTGQYPLRFKPMSILFYSKSPEYGWLSNFSEHGFTLEGIRWPSVEHFYQAQKYVGTEAAERIYQAESPLKARKAGQDRALTPCSNWEEIKLEVMRRAVRAKFEQNQRLRKLLVSTGDEELVHESGIDLFWGQTQNGVGHNWLGEILMEVRQILLDLD